MMSHSVPPPPTSTFYHYDRMFSSNPNPSMSSSQGSTESATYYNEIQMDDGKWTREQTQVLIDTWKTHKYTLLSTASSSAEHFRVWKLISNEVNKLSPPKSLQQCKKKFRNIRYICKTAMNNNKQCSAKKHYPMFYSDFVEIISESERNKDGLRGDMPSVEILRDGSMDDSSIDIEEQSPRAEMHDPSNNINIRIDESNVNKSKPKNLLRTKNVSSFNSTDGSFHDSPRSHDGELHTAYISTDRRSVSPSVNVEDRTENDDHVEHKPAAENRPDDYCTDENLLYVPSDTFARKPKHIDVSIMGRGYPPPKRVKRTPDGFPSPRQYKSSGSHDSGTGLPTDTYPTMAPITYSQENFTAGSGNYASAALTSAARKYKTTSDLQPPLPRDINYSYARQHNDRPNPIISVESRDSSVFQPGVRENSFNDRFLDVQERQMELFSDMLNRHEQFLLRLLSQQKEAAEEAQRRDREFMLKLIEMFVKHT